MKAVLILVGLLLVAGAVLALGMPCLFGPCCRVSNERNASATLKTVTSAQADFRANDRDGNKVNDFWRGDIAGLYALKPKGETEAIKLIELSMAGADDRPVTDMTAYTVRAPKAGYWYRALLHEGEKAPDPQRFAAMAHPSEHRQEMRHTYIVSEDNIVRRLDLRRTGGVPLYPADPAAAGWSKLD
jgi:hypothetical protein